MAVSPDEEESAGRLRYLEMPTVTVNNEGGTVNARLTDKINLNVNNAGGDVNLATGETHDEDLLTQSKKEFSNVDIKNPKKLEITLYPGDSLVKHFVLKTRKWLFFNPVSHTFQIQVRYKIDGRDHIDTIPFAVDIRAPMRSSIVGALIGSVLGFVVSENENSVDLLSRDFWISIARMLIFSLVIIVAFARKSNVQQVVSVEDFWGGLFTGFLVGYSGDSFIQSILGEGNGN